MDAIQQGSEAWHRIRRTKLSGTKIWDAIGCGGSRAITDLYWYMSGKVPAKDLSCIPAIIWGRAVEDRAAEWYNRCIIRGTTTFVNSPPWQQSKSVDWLGGSPDGFVGTDGILEIKCPWSPSDKGWKASLLKYFLQVQCYLQVTNRQWADLLIYRPHFVQPMGVPDYLGNPQVTMYRIARSDPLWDHITTWCLEFMTALRNQDYNSVDVLTKEDRKARRDIVKSFFNQTAEVILYSSISTPRDQDPESVHPPVPLG